MQRVVGPEDIQPVQNETMDRIATGLVTFIPFVGLGLIAWQSAKSGIHWYDVAAFVGLYALGGAAPIPLAQLAAVMTGWHVVIGVGEAVITVLAVSSVVAARPDLVYGARGRLPALVLRTPEPVA